MTITRDFQAYHESIVNELKVTKDRIRQLIGSAHWPTDGAHKEEILKGVLRSHLPESKTVGTGFICGGDDTSRQVDIMICDMKSPTLFKEGELKIVTSDTVEAIIEVKTKLRTIPEIEDILKKVADNSEIARGSRPERCWAGLFVYESVSASHEEILKAVHKAAEGHDQRVVNCVAIGEDVFVRYWDTDDNPDSPPGRQAWAAYSLQGVAQAYFISNVVAKFAYIPPEHAEKWFPIKGGKESRRTFYMTLKGERPRLF